MRPFHLAFPVHDLAAARAFWGGTIGCPEGRSSDEWIDFDFYGHQIVAHLAPGAGDAASNPVDGHDVPVPHFGVVLPMAKWEKLAERLVNGGVDFVIPPTVRCFLGFDSSRVLNIGMHSSLSGTAMRTSLRKNYPGLVSAELKQD